jgi:hypothetical protein
MTMRKITATLFVFLLAFLANPSPAQAHHIGPYVLNSDNVDNWALVRGHDGLRFWQKIAPGVASHRGANGFAVPFNMRVKYRSIATNVVYDTPCGSSSMNTWQGQPYQPIPPDRSVQIYDNIPC